MFKSIQTRIMGYLVPFAIAVTIIVVTILLYSSSVIFNTNINNSYTREISAISQNIAHLSILEKRKPTNNELKKLLKSEGDTDYIITTNKNIIYGKTNIINYSFVTDDLLASQRTYKNQKYYRSFISKIDSPYLENWYLIIETPESILTKNINNIITLAIILLIITYIMIWILSRKVSYAIQKPVKDFSTMAEQIANGSLNKELKINTNDELSDIANSFNKIQGDLKSTMNEVLVRSGETAEMAEIMEYINETNSKLPSGIIGVDNSGIITIFNKHASEISGIDPKEVMGLNITNPLPLGISNIVDPLRACLSTSRIKLKTLTDIYNKNNDKVTILYNTMIQFNHKKKVIGALVLFKRVDDIRRFESSAEQKKSLRFLGEIAASLAHEMRNPLTSIKGYAQYLQILAGENEEIASEVEIIMNESDRLNIMLNNFLKFARPDKPNKENINMNKLIDYVLTLIKTEIPKNVFIKKNYDELPTLTVDVSQFESVLINLFINAIHAMPNGGILEISTQYNEKRNAAIISVSDTGKGISKEIADQIFVPFFTTKDEGTGLGLAICSRIIDEHNGILEVDSVEGYGTTFSILLNG